MDRIVATDRETTCRVRWYPRGRSVIRGNGRGFRNVDVGGVETVLGVDLLSG